MPATTVNWCWTSFWTELGRGSVEGRTRRRSQWMFCAKSSDVDICVGRIIQRRTRDMTRGSALDVRRVERKLRRGLGVVVWRERRVTVHKGILEYVNEVTTCEMVNYFFYDTAVY